MDTIEIHDDEIKSEEILANIRENIHKRKESGSYLDPMPEILINNKQEITLKGNENISRDLDYLTTNYEAQNKNYFISSHRPLIGHFLIKGRKLVNDEAKRYVDPVFVKQTEINACNARISRELMHKIEELNSKILEYDTKIEKLNSQILENDTKIEELNSAFSAEFRKKKMH